MARYDNRFGFWFGKGISPLVVVYWLPIPITKPYLISQPKPTAQFLFEAFYTFI